MEEWPGNDGKQVVLALNGVDEAGLEVRGAAVDFVVIDDHREALFIGVVIDNLDLAVIVLCFLYELECGNAIREAFLC